MHVSSVDLYKGQVSLASRQNWLCFTKTRAKFIDSHNFFFHFHYKLFCIKAVHLSDKLLLMCPRLWPIEHICFGLYALERLLNVRYILEKVMSMQHNFGEFKKNKEELN